MLCFTRLRWIEHNVLQAITRVQFSLYLKYVTIDACREMSRLVKPVLNFWTTVTYLSSFCNSSTALNTKDTSVFFSLYLLQHSPAVDTIFFIGIMITLAAKRFKYSPSSASLHTTYHLSGHIK